MKTKTIWIALVAMIALAPFCKAQDNTSAEAQKMENLVKNLHYQHGEITIQNGIAKLNVPPDFSYLDAADAKTVLTQIWPNPPSAADGVLGMLMPTDKSPLDEDSWGVIISYTEDGYVKDDDANKIDYSDLLKKMQAATLEGNKSRTDAGLKPIQLVGWATPPRYDAATHKLYWAKEISAEGVPIHSLNYEIRILGRRGVLDLETIAGMNQLSEIEQNNPKILAMVNFNDGNRYEDFDPKIDKVAAYGIGALVLGTIAAKAGLFKLLLVGLAAGWKFVLVGFAAVVAFFKKLFGGNKKQT